MTTKTKACQYCGSDDTELISIPVANYVTCNACRANGPERPTPEEAVADWNRASSMAAALTGGVSAIADERRRQIEAEGWTPEHDNLHDAGELALAAAAYIQGSFWKPDGYCRQMVPANWPWHPSWWKPTDKRRDLVKAGALVAAEIDRIDRAAAALPTTPAEA